MMLRPLLRGLLLLVMAVAALPSQGAEWNLDQLMQLMSQTHIAHASFTEQKSIAMLERPVESSGELFYTAPDHLEKRTLQPKAESMQLDGGTLRIVQGDKNYVLQLQRYPEIAAFIASIRGTLAGDRQALERSYALRLDGNRQDWTLLLTPKADKARKIVAQISISGTGNTLRSIRIQQADGDSSLMTITQLSSK
ncbi:MAG TPA: LolA-related protein [Methylophilaceae bacterium]|nr:LolA-related protein [Methylophilaceae bacterium]